MNEPVRVFSNDQELLNYALTHSSKLPISESKSPNLQLQLTEEGFHNAVVIFHNLKIATISYWGSFLICRKNIGLLNQSEITKLADILNTIDLYCVITHHLGYTSQDPSYVSFQVATACAKEKKRLGYITTIKKDVIVLCNK